MSEYLDNYDIFVAARFKQMREKPSTLLHAAVGVAGESGELLDIVKKHWAYGKELDREHLIEELGDIEFYLEALRQQAGLHRDHIIEANIAKLQKRYPKTYSDDLAIARLDKQEE